MGNLGLTCLSEFLPQAFIYLGLFIWRAGTVYNARFSARKTL